MSEYKNKQKEKMKAECEELANDLYHGFSWLCNQYPIKPSKIANILCDTINKTLHDFAKDREENY